MAEWHYCWRCATTVPMLDEHEWEQIAPLMHLTLGDPWQRDAIGHGEARRGGLDDHCAAARAKYRELTGYDESRVDTIWHHQLSLYGPPCANCGRLLRTSSARYCSGCGAFAKRRASVPPPARHEASNSRERG